MTEKGMERREWRKEDGEKRIEKRGWRKEDGEKRMGINVYNSNYWYWN